MSHTHNDKQPQPPPDGDGDDAAPAQDALSPLRSHPVFPVAAVLARGDHPFLFRNATEYTARRTLSDFYLPSVWRVTERPLTLPSVPSTLRLYVSRESDPEQSGAVACDIDYFGESFATLVCTGDDEFLADLILRLPQPPLYDCPFRERFRRSIGHSVMLVLERLLLVLAAFRIHWPTSADRRQEIAPADYYAARALLTNLPLVPIDRRLSPSALKTAETVFDSIQRTGHQLSLPDRSSEGHGWFTRQDAKDWTGLSYTSVKKHLQELEEGLLLSTLGQNNRDHPSGLWARIQSAFVALINFPTTRSWRLNRRTRRRASFHGFVAGSPA